MINQTQTNVPDCYAMVAYPNLLITSISHKRKSQRIDYEATGLAWMTSWYSLGSNISVMKYLMVNIDAKIIVLHNSFF